MTHKEYADSLRLIAKFFEDNQQIDLPHDAHLMGYYAANSKEQLAAIIRAFGGPCQKKYGVSFSTSFDLDLQFGSITMRITAERSTVCRPMVVGKKKVKEVVVPAREEKILPEHEEDIVEWQCGESLLAESSPGEKI